MSLLKRKQKNRRLNRMHLLDVKLRSDRVRQSRVRLAAISFGVLFATLFGCFLAWRGGEWVLNRLVYENRAFAIREIQVQSDGVIAAEQLRRWANIKPGANLFALDLARVKRDLEMVPLLASVSVMRIPPKTLRILVTEREPVARVDVFRPGADGARVPGVYQVDAEGFVMLPVGPYQRTSRLTPADDSLPVLLGVKSGELQLGRRLNSPQTTAALRLISEFAYSPMAGLVDLRSIDVTALDVLVVTTAQESEVTFGLDNLDRQLRRWREIHDLGRRLNRNVASIDLAVSNNVPVRWLEATVTPPPAKAPKTSRPRKRHV
jgi:cell division septal protein FtsQ